MKKPASTSSEKPLILYCHCAYAKVVPEDVKAQVLARLNASQADFQAVPDLCEMSARKDPALASIAGQPSAKIAACYPRAVQWLFHAAASPLPEDSHRVLNMRVQPPEDIVEELLDASPGEPQAQAASDSTVSPGEAAEEPAVQREAS